MMRFTALKLGAVQGSVIVGVSERQGAGSERLASLAWIEASPGTRQTYQCLGFDNHALDMAFDQVAIRKGGRRLYFPRSC